MHNIHQTIPDKILSLSELEVFNEILELKQKLKNDLVILAHHYQRKEIIDLSDYIGDSLELSKIASKVMAKYIIFCGVHFMAESAAILCKENQKIILPDITAGCPMADMADLGNVMKYWRIITSFIDKKNIVPITYMNSSGEIKAFCGEHGGSVCTSSNALNVFKWALDSNRKIFFLPDKNLGINTCNSLNISKDNVMLLNEPDRINSNSVEKTQVFLWNGYCHVHTHFNTSHVTSVRQNFPDALIIVHSECSEDVVKASDSHGSTSYMIKYLTNTPIGSKICIGTELNFISRLSKQNPEKKIFELSRSICPNMCKINLYNLYFSILNINDTKNFEVSENIKINAKKALNTMLECLPQKLN